MNLRQLVESVIDSSIRQFDRSVQSYDRWDRELRDVEDKILQSATEVDISLLADVRAQRIGIAFAVQRFDVVLSQSEAFMRKFSFADPNYSVVGFSRMHALHAVGDHETEIRESLRLAAEPTFMGGEYVNLLANLATLHPGSLQADEALWQKLKISVDLLRAQDYSTLPPVAGSVDQLERIAISTAAELRRTNRELEEAILQSR